MYIYVYTSCSHSLSSYFLFLTIFISIYLSPRPKGDHPHRAANLSISPKRSIKTKPFKFIANNVNFTHDLYKERGFCGSMNS